MTQLQGSSKLAVFEAKELTGSQAIIYDISSEPMLTVLKTKWALKVEEGQKKQQTNNVLIFHG